MQHSESTTRTREFTSASFTTLFWDLEVESDHPRHFHEVWTAAWDRVTCAKAMMSMLALNWRSFRSLVVHEVIPFLNSSMETLPLLPVSNSVKRIEHSVTKNRILICAWTENV